MREENKDDIRVTYRKPLRILYLSSHTGVKGDSVFKDVDGIHVFYVHRETVLLVTRFKRNFPPMSGLPRLA